MKLQGQILVLQTNVYVRKLETLLVFRLQCSGSLRTGQQPHYSSDLLEQVNSRTIHLNYLKLNGHWLYTSVRLHISLHKVYLGFSVLTNQSLVTYLSNTDALKCSLDSSWFSRGSQRHTHPSKHIY